MLLIGSVLGLRAPRSSFPIAGTRRFLTTVDVELPDRSYPIYIGSDLLSAREDNLILKHVKSKKALIVTNTKIGPLYSETVRRVLESASIARCRSIPPHCLKI